MVIEKNKVVAISYSMRDEHHNILEDNEGYSPIVYLHGAGNIRPELEIGLQGLKAGDTKEIIVTDVITKLVEVGNEFYSSEEDAVKGENLRFNVKIISVRDATKAEIISLIPLPESTCGCKPGCC